MKPNTKTDCVRTKSIFVEVLKTLAFFLDAQMCLKFSANPSVLAHGANIFTQNSAVFGVADYEFGIKIRKFKKADPIWCRFYDPYSKTAWM